MYKATYSENKNMSKKIRLQFFYFQALFSKPRVSYFHHEKIISKLLSVISVLQQKQKKNINGNKLKCNFNYEAS